MSDRYRAQHIIHLAAPAGPCCCPWRPRYSELRPTASSQINKDLQRRQPVVMFSGSVMMILKLFTRSEGLLSSLIWISIVFCPFLGGFRLYPQKLRHIAIHMNLSNKLRWIQQLHQPQNLLPVLRDLAGGLNGRLGLGTKTLRPGWWLGWKGLRKERYPIELE